MAAHGSTIRVYLAVSVTSPTRYLAVIPSGVKMTWLSMDHSCDLTSLVHTIDLESVLWQTTFCPRIVLLVGVTREPDLDNERDLGDDLGVTGMLFRLEVL